MRSPAQRVFDHHANHKSSFWERENKIRKTKKLAKLFFLIVLLFALGNLLVRVPSWFQSFNKPFERIQSNVTSNGDMNSNIRTNILLISVSNKDSLQDLALASFSSNMKSLTIIKLPIGVKTYTSGSELESSLGAIYFGKPYFDSRFDSTYTATKELLAIPLDGYFFFTKDNLEFTQESVDQVRGRLYSLSSIIRVLAYKSWLDDHMKTNYSMSALLNLSWDFRRINSDKLRISDLKEAVKKKKLNSAEVDSFLQEAILDSVIVNEAAVVEISNGSYYSNLVKRVVNNLGANTISLSEVGEGSKTRIVLGSNKSKTANRIASFLGVEVEKGEVESGADVKVIIGEDFNEIFYGK